MALNGVMLLKVFLHSEFLVKTLDQSFPNQYGHHMAKQRISLDQITSESLALVDRDGFDALSLSNVADGLGVGPSALYTHLDGLDGLRHLVAVAATDNLTSDVRNAAIGTSGETALSAMGAAYRGFAQGHPGQFASTLLPPRSADDDLAKANESLVDVFALVYGAMGMDRSESHLAARSTRSAIHGFLALEHTSAGPSSANDAEYQHLLDTLQRGPRSLTDRNHHERTEGAPTVTITEPQHPDLSSEQPTLRDALLLLDHAAR